MTLSRSPVAILLACLLNVSGLATTRSQIEAALDSWSGRPKTRLAVLEITRDPIPSLAIIAQSPRESYSRRMHSISLLATFKARESETALVQIAKHAGPEFRCVALQALAELDPQRAIPVLIRKLDDHSICMRMASTDPAAVLDVYVSDEAVRLLELTTGQSFGAESIEGHRSIRPWKDWWTSKRSKSKAKPF
jgi:hypothetical protein